MRHIKLYFFAVNDNHKNRFRSRESCSVQLFRSCSLQVVVSTLSSSCFHNFFCCRAQTIHWEGNWNQQISYSALRFLFGKQHWKFCKSNKLFFLLFECEVKFVVISRSRLSCASCAEWWEFEMGGNMICIGATCSSVSLVLRKLRLYYLNHMKKYRVIDSDQKQLVDHLVYVRRCTFSVVGWTLDPNLLLPATLTLTSWLDSYVIRYLSLVYHFNDSTRQFRFPELIVPKEIKVMMRVHKQLKRPKILYHVNLGHRAQLEAKICRNYVKLDKQIFRFNTFKAYEIQK